MSLSLEGRGGGGEEDWRTGDRDSGGGRKQENLTACLPGENLGKGRLLNLPLSLSNTAHALLLPAAAMLLFPACLFSSLSLGCCLFFLSPLLSHCLLLLLPIPASLLPLSLFTQSLFLSLSLSVCLPKNRMGHYWPNHGLSDGTPRGRRVTF